MKQADELINRILFLEGLPNLQQLGKLQIGENTEEMLQCDFNVVEAEIVELKEAIALCEDERDYISKDLLKDILEYEEDYIDWIETQQLLITNLGLENYQQTMMES